jgi:hypothetical protein
MNITLHKGTKHCGTNFSRTRGTNLSKWGNKQLCTGEQKWTSHDIKEKIGTNFLEQEEHIFLSEGTHNYTPGNKNEHHMT